MCGRYVSISTPEELADAFEVDDVRTESLGERYNVAPTLDVYSVIELEGTRRLGTLRWGFIPFWAKTLKDAPTPINARVDSLAGNMFKDSFRRRRCILPADGFYEWQERESSSKKQPYYIHDPAGAPLAFAGIWSSWRDPTEEDPEPVYSCAIVTTDATGPLKDIHERMPVMLPPTLWADWLTAGEDEAPHLHEAVAQLGAPTLEARRITTRVNNVRNDGPELLEPGEVA